MVRPCLIVCRVSRNDEYLCPIAETHESTKQWHGISATGDVIWRVKIAFGLSVFSKEYTLSALKKFYASHVIQRSITILTTTRH